MKKILFIVALLTTVLLNSCSMEATIPENGVSMDAFLQKKDLYDASVTELSKYDFDLLISRTDYYAPKGSEDFSSLYMQNMNDMSFSAFDGVDTVDLFRETDVKLVDLVIKDGLTLCVFDLCRPNKNFDYGYYYVSVDNPVYIGDPSVSLTPNGDGFSYEKKASYGNSSTFYTEKIEDHYYYYEIY